MEDELPTVQLVPVAYEDKAVLRRLLELYCYDFSEFTDDDVNAHGEYGCLERLDYYWIEKGRYPFFVKVGDKLAGFVLVRAANASAPDALGEVTGHTIAEFFVMRKYRRRAVGQTVAWQVFDRFPGRWSVDEMAANQPAIQFWRKVIGAYTGGDYRELRHAGGGPVQVFTAKGDA